MADSIYSNTFKKAFKDSVDLAKKGQKKQINCNGKLIEITIPYPSPEDWRDCWIYFLMIDRFCNTNSNPKCKWNDSDCDKFQGGDLNGITDKLDYLEKLGVKAIWITPPFKNCIYKEHTYHGYGIQDFLTVDPRFGTAKDLKELVCQAHARGIYVIFDIVLNHTGSVFAYDFGNGETRESAEWRESAYDILWYDQNGKPKWDTPPSGCGPDACVWPKELQYNPYFRRQGKGGEYGGDFEILKELYTEYEQGAYRPVQDILIKSYQYIILNYDVDGFRIDTLKFVSRDFSQIFGNAMREFALSIGKKNFFTFGEVWDDEAKITEYIGRYTHDEKGIIGVDAALDFPLFGNIQSVIKGFAPPCNLIDVFKKRKEYQKNHISSHGEASKFFVTFFDNHDLKERFYYDDKNKYDLQVLMAIGTLFTLQGIPCIYYGTEQGLSGRGTKPEAVREALWGKNPTAFDENHPFYKHLKEMSNLRSLEPALRYGRQYFRQISENKTDFVFAMDSPGTLAYSRILNDEEIIIIMNTKINVNWAGDVIVDFFLNTDGQTWNVLYTNYGGGANQKAAATRNNVAINKLNGERDLGAVRVLPLTLRPMEIQIIKRAN